MKKKSIHFLLLMVMLMCSALPSFAAEDYLESYFDTSNMIPDRNFAKFRICFYNDCGKDSWISSPLYIYVDDELVCSTNDYTGEDVDDRKCSWNNHSYNKYCSNAKQNIKVEFRDRYDSGCDSWVWVYVYFSRLYEGKAHKVGYAANYNPNHGKANYSAGSHTYTVDLSCMKSVNNTMGSSSPYTATLSNTTTKYNKDHRIVLFKNYKSEENASTWNDFGSSEYYLDKTVPGGSKAFTVEYKVPSNYSPTYVYPKYYMYSDGDIIYMDYLSIKVSPYFPRPKSVYYEYDQWTRKVKLSWQKDCYDKNTTDDGVWMITRQEEGKDDTWQYLGSVEKNTCSYEDKSIDEQGYDKTFIYRITYVPKSWGNPGGLNFKNIYAEDLTVSKSVNFSRGFDITLDVTSPGSFFDIYWKAKSIPVSGLTYIVQRKKEGANNFEDVKTVSAGTQKFEYECSDDYELDATAEYTYRIALEAMGKTFYSKEVSQVLADHSRVVSFGASKGVYNNTIRLSWTAVQVGETETHFVIYRKSVDKKGKESVQNYKQIYSTTGTSKSYTYTDQAINNGVFYSYKIESYSLKSDGVTKYALENMDDVGFSSQTGTISGSINFAGGTAVDSVKVGLEMIDENGSPKPTYSLFSQGKLNSGLKWELDENNEKLFTNKSWTIQLFVNPSSDGNDVSEFMQLGNMVAGLKKSANGFSLLVNGNEIDGVVIPVNVFSSLTLSYSKDGDLEATLIDNNDSIQTGKMSGIGNIDFSKKNNFNNIIIGGSQTDNEARCYYGYVDDIRIFSGRKLSLAEIKTTYNRVLSGSENELIAYWTMDEGIDKQSQAFDYSMQNGSANENHAIILANSSLLTNTPSPEQLCLYTLTDKDGNYIIRGVPYYDEGSNYIVRPTKGTHDFSPATVTRYFSSSSSVYGGSDFTDKSSFPVSGKVYYEGTNYPVEGCELYIDGIAASKEGEIVRTDKEGFFSFDIPIGNHSVSVKKNGHVFSYGRYPASGTHFFDRAVSELVFKDSTTVVIAGRVTGGQDEYIKPLGFNTSVNNIGQATIVLDAGMKMNTSSSARSYKNVVDGMNCEAVTTPKNSDSANLITIKTDTKSGEFAVKLPPILYQVKSVDVEGNPSIEFNNLSSINATNALIENTDSISEDSVNWKYFKYNDKLKLSYRSKPVLAVTPLLPSRTFFGEASEEIVKENGDTVNVAFYDESTGKYTYDYPVFMQYNYYNWKLEAYEPYTNYNSGKSYKVPLRGIQVSASNYMSVGNYVTQNGEMYEVVNGQIDLDSLGTAVYRFQVGFPNIAEPYTLPVKFSYNIDGTNYSEWLANGVDGSDFKGIVFGDLPSGNNFVTAGPTIVDMVLRDPPGSSSYASWTEGTSVTNSYKFNNTHTTNSTIKVTANFGVESSTAAGLGVMVITPMKVDASTQDDVTTSKTWSEGNGWTTVTTATSTISTSSDPMFDGPDADVFIGKSSNEIIGKARDVNLHEIGGQLVPSVKELFTRGLKFGTQFNYTQNEILNHEIPQYKDLIYSMLISKGTEVKNTSTYYKYLSKVESDDPSYGTPGSYELIEPTNVTEEIVLKDSIEWCWEQIKNWQDRLGDNERAKVACINNRESLIDENYSFDSGTRVEKTFSRSNTYSTSSSSGTTLGNSISITSGLKVMGVGTSLSTSTGYTCNSVSSNSTDASSTSTFKFALVETGANDAISVDVYNTVDSTKHIDNFGPIFVTRAGRTSGNYEPQHTTRFYSPGTVIMSGTSKINVPDIICENSIVTGVRTGSSAIIKFNLNNLSETKNKGYYYFLYDTGANKDGAIIRCGDADLANNVEYLIDYNTPITATVTLTQSNMDVLDYRIPFILKDKYQNSNADTVFVEVHFEQASSGIELATKNYILNKTLGDSVTFVMSGYDMNMKNLKSFNLQYKGENDTEWHNAEGCEWRMNENVTIDAPICTSPSVTCGLKMSNTSFFPDQTYQFRARTVSNFGGDDVFAYSEEIEVLKDMVAPVVFGKPNPINGVYGIESEIGVSFNEDVIKPTKSNVTLKGILNNSTVNHEVALYCDGTRVAASESRVGNITDFTSCNFWLKRMNGKEKVEGTILGDMTNGCALNVDPQGHLIFRKDDNQAVVSENAIPENQWTFVAVSYSGDEEGNVVISADYADEGTGEVVSLFNKKVIPFEIPDNIGRIYIGDDFVGCIQELTLWDAVRSFDVANSEKSLVKTQYTNGLKAYWPLTDGKGMIAKEIVHDISLALASESNWRINRSSYALKLTAKQSVYSNTNLSNIATNSNQDYFIQFWFAANAAQSTPSTLFSINNGQTKLQLNGQNLYLESEDFYDDVPAPKIPSLFDKKWHRVALCVRKSNNGNASLYYDGKVVATYPSYQVSDLMGKLTLGGNFDGCIDEFRIWHGSSHFDDVDTDMYQSLNPSEEDDLVLYYPFETTKTGEGNQKVVAFSYSGTLRKNGSTSTSSSSLSRTGSPTGESQNVPPVASAPQSKSVNFTLSSTERELKLKITDPMERVQGCTLTAKVSGLTDLAGNKMTSAYSWKFDVDMSNLYWEKDTVTFDDNKFVIVNRSSVPQSWNITNVPSWMTLESTSGVLQAGAKKEISYSRNEFSGIGFATGSIYLNETNGISHPLTYKMNLCENIPWFNFDVVKGKKLMTVIGQVEFNGEIVRDNESSTIAAYSDSVLVGVGELKYIDRLDGSYVTMTIYGDSIGSEPLRFGYFDAKNDEVHPYVKCCNQDTFDIYFTPDNIIGSYSSPVRFVPSNQIRQKVVIGDGWNLISFNVQSDDKSLNSLYVRTSYDALPDDADMLAVIHDDEVAFYKGDEWTGDDIQIKISEAYLVYSDCRYLDMYNIGYPAYEQIHEITLRPGWTWLGANLQRNTTIKRALSDLVSYEDDMIRDRENTASYVRGGWVGTLDALKPGQGYMYYSHAETPVHFHYPTKATLANKSLRNSVLRKSAENELYYGNLNSAKYAGTMVVVASVEQNGLRLEDVELAAFDDNGEIRGEKLASTKDGLVYMVIHGDANCDISLKAVVPDGDQSKVIDIPGSLRFRNCDIIGSPSEPYVIDLDATGIIDAAAIDNASSELYDLSGRRIVLQKNVQRGIYIRDGRKVLVR